MYPIDTLMQKMQDSSAHTQTLLEYFRNAILWSCLFFIFVKGIAGMNLSSENRHKLPPVPAADDAYKQHINRRRRVFNRYGVQVLPAIPEEDDNSNLSNASGVER
ncbi:hypothetical protein EMCG_02920 [[Emmonsia] crescens]|uniref:Uncharacterized protein n=1 Tax=[Emmonsia] crescens TaxID=73230 RepID=A0A0G2J0X1_9EURO|nr:hypothetical protein EMCG_02920 [Emmonsia crescens UAMH 3008]